VLETTYGWRFSYIPHNVLAVKTLQCDPLPPPTAVTAHSDAFFEGTEDLRAFMPSITARQRAQQGRGLAQIIPDPGVREQLQVCISFVYAHINTNADTVILRQAFFSAMPEVQERFPEAAA
jgi:hypothetical protein